MPSGIDGGISGGHVFQFASGPVQAEPTGPASTPDGKTLFLAIQHPGEESQDPNNPMRAPGLVVTSPSRPSSP